MCICTKCIITATITITIIERWSTGVVICLERGADLHMAQLMPLPLTVSCFSKIQTDFTFLIPAHLGSPRKGPLNGCVCVCVYYHYHVVFSASTLLAGRQEDHLACKN